ncbi:hypothetical protein LTR93_011161 [Exophiala xenobiotica]|nr:hypothetical protein LTR93_011161 [Exophiala xenobiotica]
MSANGIRWTNSETNEIERVTTSRAILPGAQYTISAGVIDLILQIPPRGEDQQAMYDHNFRSLRQEAEQAMPTMNGLRVHPHGTITPMVVGRKRTGAMAIVHKAIDYETGDEYKLVDHTEFHLSSMLNEIKILQQVRHENIIEYIDLFKDPDPILVMEIAIRSLAEHKMTEVSDCVTLLKDSLAGLAYLHQTNIIHRDIKPANILLTREDPVQWKLSDYGMSKMAEVPTTFCGSPMYLAPEIGGWNMVHTPLLSTLGFGNSWPRVHLRFRVGESETPSRHDQTQAMEPSSDPTGTEEPFCTIS